MSGSTISRARLHDLAALGRSGLTAAGGAGLRETCASPRRPLTDASASASDRRGAPEHPARAPEHTNLVEPLI
jgi:hypothetical protein